MTRLGVPIQSVEYNIACSLYSPFFHVRAYFVLLQGRKHSF